MGYETKTTPQQQRFIEEYLIDPTSITNAAKRAGYSLHSAKFQGSRLLHKPHIKAAIEDAQAERAARLGITQDRVLQELALIAFANMKDIAQQDAEGNTVVDMKGMSREVAAALGEITISTRGGKVRTQTSKVRMNDKLGALEKLAKHLGMFVDKVEHTGVLTLEQLVSQSMSDKEEDEV